MDEANKASWKEKFDGLVKEGLSEDDAIAKLVASADVSANSNADNPKEENIDVKIDEGSTLLSKKIPLSGLLEAIDETISRQKTPIIVDTSEDKKVDTFFSYRSVKLLDAKKCALDKSLRKVCTL